MGVKLYLQNREKRQDIEKERARESSRSWKHLRKKLAKLLHMHPVLIAICVLSVVDSACVVGELMVDLTVFNDRTPAGSNETVAVDCHHPETDVELEQRLKNVLKDLFQNSFSNKTIEQIVDDLHVWLAMGNCSISGASHVTLPVPTLLPTESPQNTPDASPEIPNDHPLPFKQASVNKKTGNSHYNRDHNWQLDLSHALHTVSLIILSTMVLVNFLRVFCVGKAFFRRKLEVFDAFVVAASLAIDLAFLDGIWEMENFVDSAMLLVILLPWRVVRIVNSFILTVHQKDHITMKMLKSGRKRALEKASHMRGIAERYKKEIRALRGVCKKYDVNEEEVNACKVTLTHHAHGRSRRGSSTLFLSAMASVTMLKTLGIEGACPDDSETEGEDGADMEDIDDEQLADSLDDLTNSGSDLSTEQNSEEDGFEENSEIEVSIDEQKRMSFTQEYDTRKDSSNGIVNPLFISLEEMKDDIPLIQSVSRQRACSVNPPSNKSAVGFRQERGSSLTFVPSTDGWPSAVKCDGKDTSSVPSTSGSLTSSTNSPWHTRAASEGLRPDIATLNVPAPLALLPQLTAHGRSCSYHSSNDFDQDAGNDGLIVDAPVRSRRTQSLIATSKTGWPNLVENQNMSETLISYL